jgi:hypothetical protein
MLVGVALVYLVLAALVDSAWRRHSDGTQGSARPG